MKYEMTITDEFADSLATAEKARRQELYDIKITMIGRSEDALNAEMAGDPVRTTLESMEAASDVSKAIKVYMALTDEGKNLCRDTLTTIVETADTIAWYAHKSVKKDH